MLKTEIVRLSRKEVRVQLESLKKANSAYRRDIAELKRQVAALQRLVAGAGRARVAKPEVDAEVPARFVAKGLRSLRARLDLSAAQFGQLAGASAQSIYNWESGKAVPRKTHMAALAGLRSLGKREAQARLVALKGPAAKNK